MPERREDLGPTLPPRGAVHAQAVELLALAHRAVEFAGKGPTADLGAALVQFERMRAILGPSTLSIGEGDGPWLDQPPRA